MWGKVWVLPLCTVIVAILSAPSASGQSCSCGGPTSSAPSTAAITPADCLGDGVTACPSGFVCVCSIDFDTETTNQNGIIAGEAPIIEWYCLHDGNDGYCTREYSHS